MRTPNDNAPAVTPRPELKLLSIPRIPRIPRQVSMVPDEPKRTPPRVPLSDYELVLEAERRRKRQGRMDRPPTGTGAGASVMWVPAKIMATGFIATLASMMVIPELKLNIYAIAMMFSFAGALNIAIALPIAVVIIKGKFTRTGELFGS